MHIVSSTKTIDTICIHADLYPIVFHEANIKYVAKLGEISRYVEKHNFEAICSYCTQSIELN